MPWSWNKYSYVRANPVGSFDPSGLLTKQECTELWKGTVDGDYCVLPNGKRYFIDGNQSGGTEEIGVTAPDPGDPEPNDARAVINWLRWRRIQNHGPVIDYIGDGAGPDRERTPWLRCFVQNVSSNVKQTNSAIPGLAAPTGLGMVTARKMAQDLGTLTIGEYISWGFPAWRMNGVKYSSLGTGVQALKSGASNAWRVGLFWEAGVIAGSILNVAVGSVVAPEMLNLVCYEE